MKAFFTAARNRGCQQPSHAARVYRCLQQMSSVARQDAIRRCMRESQRLALEAYMVSVQKHAQKKSLNPKAVASNQQGVPALHDANGSHSGGVSSGDVHGRGRNGICRSVAKGRLYGFYAKTGIMNLTFWGQIHRELADAIRDHILLSRVLEQIRSYASIGEFTSNVRDAMQSVLLVEGLDEGMFLRTVTVRFSAQHWLGRSLAVHFSKLEDALNAWKRLREVQGSTHLFAGGHGSADYTFEGADRQWCRLRRLFVELQAGIGRRARQRIRCEDAEAQLAAWEAAYNATRAKKLARFRLRQERLAAAAAAEAAAVPCGKGGGLDRQAALLKRLQRVLQVWDRAATAEERQRRLAWRRRQLEKLTLNRKRRWDGKESLEAFKCRLQASAREP